jgi:hypothetical protein
VPVNLYAFQTSVLEKNDAVTGESTYSSGEQKLYASLKYTVTVSHHNNTLHVSRPSASLVTGNELDLLCTTTMLYLFRNENDLRENYVLSRQILILRRNSTA